MGNDRLSLYGGVAALLAVVLFAAAAWSRFVSDFWPPDRSFIGPNIVASAVLLSFSVVALLKRLKHLHAKVDHLIINHPDIPNTVPGVPEKHQPKPS